MADEAELVKILDEKCLIDSESYQRSYQTRAWLLPGYYIGIWKGDVARRAYDDNAQYFGPYDARSDAQRLLGGRRRTIQGSDREGYE